jgi:hypothetical protein
MQKQKSGMVDAKAEIADTREIAARSQQMGRPVWATSSQ